ncbi:MAG: RrF2 family transcriptional regulator [Lachnospiraceae bacterium]|nr:RrF2 family transcriptional regulator [Lachnospiraceae bacterium]
MLISSRGRYALRVMIDLAEHNTGEYTPLKEISARQNISRKYLENIMTVLSKADYVEGVHGKGGGYRLNRAPEEYIIGDLLRLTEGTLAPVACLECENEPCVRAGECRTLPIWDRLNTMINGYLDSVSLGDIIREGDQDKA